MSQIAKRRIILAGAQSARGAAATVAAATDFLEASGFGTPKFTPVVVENNEFKGTDGPSQPDNVDPLWDSGEDEFAVRLATLATGVLPLDPFLQAMGFAGAAGGGNYAYNHTSDPAARKLLTLEKYVDGEVFKLMDLACVGTLSGKLGEPLILKADGLGIANGTTPSVATFPASVTSKTTQGRLIMSSGSAITQDAVAIGITEFELGFGLDRQEFYNTADGRGSELVDWKPELKITKVADPASGDWAKLEAATSVAVVLTFGSGRTLVISCPVAVPIDIDPTDINQRIHHGVTLSLHESAGDDAVTLTST